MTKMRKHLRKKKNSYISSSTLNSIKSRNKAWRKFRTFESAINYEEYRLKRNAVVDNVRRDRRRYQRDLIDSFKDRPKKFYGYIRRLQHVKGGTTALQKVDGSNTTSDFETAEVLDQWPQNRPAKCECEGN